MQHLFCVTWTPPISNFFPYIRRFRELSKIPLGGTKVGREYGDRTSATVLSIGENDSRSSFPQRVSLSNFKLGSPITSYGCIYRSVTDKIRYLLIKRKESVGYVDLIRGSYKESQLFFIVQDLTNEERERLLKYDFDDLWDDMGLNRNNKEAYEYAKSVYSCVKSHLPLLFSLIPTADPDGMNLWLFPKGKLNFGYDEELFMDDLVTTQESPFECALREFKEETNGMDIRVSAKLLCCEPVVERYLGSNSKHYQTNYFIFGSNTLPDLNKLEKRITNIREVSCGEVEEVKWVPIDEIHNYLKPERVKLVEYIENNNTKVYVDDVSPLWHSTIELVDENKY